MKTAVFAFIVASFLVGAPAIKNETVVTEAPPTLAQAIWAALGGK